MSHLRGGAVGLAALLAVSVSGVTLAQDEPVEISYLTHWGPDQVAQLEEVAAAFEAENPDVSVEIRAVPFGDLLTTIKTQAASPGGPTIASTYNRGLPEHVRDGDAAAAPDDYAADISANWPTGAYDGASVDG
jgi:multiple sugar transport system substrate-binding protein